MNNCFLNKCELTAAYVFMLMVLVWFQGFEDQREHTKYGLIFHSSFIGRASAKNKGRMARYLANKCSIASRIDCFSGLFVILLKVVSLVYLHDLNI